MTVNKEGGMKNEQDEKAKEVAGIMRIGAVLNAERFQELLEDIAIELESALEENPVLKTKDMNDLVQDLWHNIDKLREV